MELMNTSELAEFLRTTPNAIRVMRARGKGPPFLKVSKEVLYDVNDIKKWLEQNKVRKNEKTVINNAA